MTRLDVITKALRDIGVLAIDEAPEANDEASVGDVFDAIYAELSNEAITFSSSFIPADLFIGLSQMVAADAAPMYGRQAPVSRARAKLRMNAVMNPDNRASRSDEAEYY